MPNISVAWMVLYMLQAQISLDDLERLDKALLETTQHLHAAASATQQLQSELSDLRAELAIHQEQRDATFKRYKQRIQILARPAQQRLQMARLLGAHTLSHYVQNGRILRLAAQHDKSLHAYLHEETQRLLQTEKKVATQSALAAQALQNLEAKRLKLISQRQQRSNMLARIHRQNKQAGPEALQFVEDRKMVQQQLQHVVQETLHDSHDDALSDKRGHLPWPVMGRVLIAFGEKTELAFGTTTSHNGWDIQAPSDSNVIAIAAGQVVYAGWLRGYGELVIVDHGGGYHAVCAHLGRIDVHVGDSVNTYDTIGAVGDTGSLRGTVLYFELRHRGKPINPKNWLTKDYVARLE